jgi:hypothetical protein
MHWRMRATYFHAMRCGARPQIGAPAYVPHEVPAME